MAGLDAVSPEAAGEGADAAPADTAAGTMHDVYDDHLSDYSPSLARDEELDGVMPPNTAATEDDDPSAFGAPAAEAAPATDFDAEELEVMEAEEGSVARGLAQPSQPTAREVAEHNLTHLPFRAWCRHCVRGKGLTTAHKRLVDDLGRRVPEVSMDYFYMGDKDDISLPLLIIRDNKSKRVFTHSLPSKGVHQYSVAIAARSIKQLGYAQAILKTDTERPILALRNELIKQMPSLRPEDAVKGESQTNAEAESMVSKMQGQIRTMKDALEFKYDMKLHPRHVILPWLVDFAGAVWSRYQLGPDGRTAYERSTGKQWKQKLPEFGECVFYRPLKEKGGKQRKLDAKFEDGIFLGIQEGSALKWIGTSEGVLRAWSLKLKPPSDKWDRKQLDAILGLPWGLRPPKPDQGAVSPMLERPLQIDLPEAPAQTVEEPSEKQKDYLPRGVYLRKDVEFAKHGYTPGCDGCIAAEFGMARRHHTPQCRSRLYEAMMQDEQGKARIEQARQREMRYFEKVREDMEAVEKSAVPDKRPADTDLAVPEFDLPLQRDSSTSASAKQPRLVPSAQGGVGHEGPHLAEGGSNPPFVQEGQTADAEMGLEAQQLAPQDPLMDIDALMPVWSLRDSRQAASAEIQKCVDILSLQSELHDEDNACRRLALKFGCLSLLEAYMPEKMKDYKSPQHVLFDSGLGVSSGLALDLNAEDEFGVPWDFSRPDHREKLQENVAFERPLLLVGSAQFGSFSAWDKAHASQSLEKVKTHLKHCCELYKLQMDDGRYFVHEFPWEPSGWYSDSMSTLLQDSRIICLPMEQNGLRLTTVDWDGYSLVMKTMGFLTNSESIARALQRVSTSSLSVWKRTDVGLQHAVTVSKHGPRWDTVVRRVIRNTQTGEIIQDLHNPQQYSHKHWYCALPPNTELETLFFYRASPKAWRRRIHADSGQKKGLQPYPGAVNIAILEGLLNELTRRGSLHSLSAGPVNQEEDLKFDVDLEDDWLTFIDEISGKPLSAQLVVKAREEELSFAHKYGVWDVVDEAECWANTNAAPIGVRWIDINKGDEARPNYRSRLVVQEIRRDPHAEYFAATPPLESLRFLLSLQRTGGFPMKMKISFIDIKRAHWTAKVQRLIYVRLPPEEAQAGKCARLNKSMYGCKDAAQNWELEITSFFLDHGFTQGLSSPVIYVNALRSLYVSVHGDDITSLGPEASLNWLRDAIMTRYEIKYGGMLGPDREDLKDVSILNRLVSFEDSHTTYEADPRHVQILLRELGVAGAKPVSSPGVAQQSFENKELSAEDTKMYRSLTMRAAYLSMDRPDIIYSVKEAARDMSRPTESSWLKLKRLARYLIGKPRLVWTFTDQNWVGKFVIKSDSDDAGCKETRKSTSSGFLFHGAHLIKCYSSTQHVLSLSSGESEFYAGLKAASVLLGALAMAADFGFELKGELHMDASAAKSLISRRGHGKAKHISRCYLWIQQRIQSNDFSVHKVRTDDNEADLGTKYLDWGKILHLCTLAGLVFQETTHRKALQA